MALSPPSLPPIVTPTVGSKSLFRQQTRQIFRLVVQVRQLIRYNPRHKRFGGFQSAETSAIVSASIQTPAISSAINDASFPATGGLYDFACS
jgi:hypothetical protein